MEGGCELRLVVLNNNNNKKKSKGAEMGNGKQYCRSSSEVTLEKGLRKATEGEKRGKLVISVSEVIGKLGEPG